MTLIDAVSIERVEYPAPSVDAKWGYWKVLAKHAGKWLRRKTDFATAEEAYRMADTINARGAINPVLWRAV